MNSDKKNRVKMTNLGQIIFIFFLLSVIFMQTAGIISGSADLSVNNAGNQNPPAIDSYGANQNANNTPQSINDNIIVENDDTAQDAEIFEALFILGENNGRLAVLSPDRQTVYETFDVYINTLPDYDKNLLKNGIEIKTAEQLYSLLEDYNS